MLGLRELMHVKGRLIGLKMKHKSLPCGQQLDNVVDWDVVALGNGLWKNQPSARQIRLVLRIERLQMHG